MSFISVFDVLGPNMIGPSSSHTAGACAIAHLAQKMKIFLDHPEKIRVLGDNGFAWSTTMFTQEKNARGVEEVYAEVLAERERKKDGTGQ